MDNQFRSRIATPILMLIGLVVVIAIIAFSISRVLLAVPALVGTFTALILGAYVLLLAVMIGKRTAITGRTLGAGMAVGLVALLGAGVVAAQAGTREIHHGDEEGHGGGEEVASEPVAEIPDDAFVWVAVDVDFSESPTTIPAGEVTIAIDNQGNLPHNVVLTDLGVRVDADGNAQAATTVTLEPGTYDYVCDIPGHAGTMNGTIEVQ
jgi:plastocyanin